jgi:hypothetical protein
MTAYRRMFLQLAEAPVHRGPALRGRT